jgi:starch synthase
MISSEVESLARTGGLGDMVEALSLALAQIGCEVVLVTPLYGVTRLPKVTNRWAEFVPVRWGWGPDDVRQVGIVELEATRFPSGGARRVCLLDDPGLYQRHGIYDDAWGAFSDNGLRFAVMSRGGLEVGARVWAEGPDVLHAHDWHAAFSVVYARTVMGERWAKTPSVFTVHNLAFQGLFDEGALDRLHLPRALFRPEVLWHHGNVNVMKGATALADRITTVSPTYAREILEPEAGFGLDRHLRAHAYRLDGIVNGIETTRWDPRTDTAIAAQYDERTFQEGRAACKAALANELALDPGDGPLFATVARLTWQKGIDLLRPLLGELVAQGSRIALVGQGDRVLEDQLMHAADEHRGRVSVRIAFDPPLSRRVYAGADFFLVPSRFEPCGLTQMYAMRYGAVPIVTDVGGLHDTVDPIDTRADRGSGIIAAKADVPALRAACLSATNLFHDRPALDRAIPRAMRKDFAWEGPARRYLELYRELLGSRSRVTA